MSTVDTADLSRIVQSDRHIADRLEQARSRLEERFLEGGDVLSQALQSIGEMIAVLDKVTSSLGQDTVDATVADLSATGQQLLALPQVHAGRHAKMVGLSDAGKSIQGDVAAMLETMRYLRTFAVTVKITGAGAAEFASFADEMLEKIQTGRNQVDDFASQLLDLRDRVRTAVSLGQDLSVQYDDVVPEVSRALSNDAARIGVYRADVRRITLDLADLVRQVQGKVARVLSALQIGDMTRQRIEHVQAGLGLLTTEAHDLGEPGRAALLRLLAAQTEDLLEEFNNGCATVTSSLGSLAANVKEIVALGRQARGNSSGGGEGFLRALEDSVANARQLIGRIEAAGARSEQISQSSAATARTLTESVDSIRAIRSEIQYMAINTSLRCSRLGEAGKPMNVVATELRTFADQMESVSDRLLAGLGRLSEAANTMLGDASDATQLIGHRLDDAIAKIRDAGARTGDDLKDLSARGDAVARSVGNSVAKLDFARELGDVLDECSCVLSQAAADADQGMDAVTDSTTAVAERLFATYTMARERDVHRRYFAAQTTAEPTQVAAVDDDLDAVLF